MKKGFGIILVLILIAGGGYFATKGGSTKPNLDGFAQCLTERNAKMWGAYWCPHCQNQKKEFGKSWDKVKYIECSLPGGSGQTNECKEAGIEGYPTWEFEGGERIGGEVPLTDLAEKTGCSLPEGF